jgi:hypothetical protein
MLIHASTENAMSNKDQPARGANSAQPNRSENLLPAGRDDQDGRFDVAEEVNLDQQSDTARRVGQANPDPAPDVPGTGKPAPGGA